MQRAKLSDGSKTSGLCGKGQISIPKDVRRDMKLKEGETLVMISDGESIVLQKPENVSRNKDVLR